MRIRHLLLDRDGVLNREREAGWITDPNDWQWQSGALDALRRFSAAGCRMTVVTNQSCIGRGVVTPAAVEAVHSHAMREAEQAGARIAGILVCPHAPDDGCACRKPKPGLLFAAMAASGIAPEETVLLGDAARDLEAGRAAGIPTGLLRTGKGRAVQVPSELGKDTTPRWVFESLGEAADVLLAANGSAMAPSAASKRQDIVRRAFEEHRRVVEDCAALPEFVEQAAALVLACLRSGGKVLACGNGGSAADAQHFAAELVARFTRERPGLAAIALTTDTSTLTAVANDYGYEKVFARQTAALGRRGDVLIALSTSGNSPNVLAAVREARGRGLQAIALTGRGGGELAALADLLLVVPSATVARIQEMHELCLHALADRVEAEFAGEVDEA